MNAAGLLILGVCAHVLCAGVMLRRQARLLGGWDLEMREALLGQSAATFAGLLAASLVMLAAAELGMAEVDGLYGLGAFVLVAAWGTTLVLVVAWLAQRSKGAFVSPATMRRVSSFTFFSVLTFYGCGAGAASALWWIIQPAVPVETAPTVAGEQQGAAASGPAPLAPAATPAVPAIAAATVASAPAQAQDAVLAAVGAWAAAWTRRDADGYLAAYAPEFRVPGGLSRAQWETQRRGRIGAAASIAVGIQEPQVHFADADHATVSFRQDYRSNRVSTVDSKTLRMARRGGHWLIVEELSTR